MMSVVLRPSVVLLIVLRTLLLHLLRTFSAALAVKFVPLIMRYVTALLLLLIFINVFAQREEHIVFDEPIDTDTLTTRAEPMGGYKALLKHLEWKISDGDTVGRKFSLHLYNVRFKVNRRGMVDSTYIGVNHSACPVHDKLAAELRQTKWRPAKERCKPVNSHEELYGHIQLTKNVLRKYDCWPSFIDRLLFGLH